MASSRSPSPAAGNMSEPSSPQLSPRSKLQAMLAAVDDNSDDEESGPIDVKALLNSANKNTTSPDEAQPTTHNNEDDDDGSEDEDEIIRPRGRLASRMQADITNEPRVASKTPDDEVHETAAPTDNEDNEDDISALPRRRIARPARSISPEPTVDADQPSSPGLFVSPSKSTTSHHSGAGSDSDDDFPADLAKSDRFKALVARKRQERLAKEAEEARKQKERAERMAETMPADADSDDDVSDITDDDGGRQLTQSQRGHRAPRKASKKALEEMNRETQRINRSLQLAHEAKTKKKISKSSLFERFNFKPEGGPAENKPASSSRPSTPVSHQTDVEMGEAGTPPSSPPLPNNPKSTINPSIPPMAPAKPGVEDDDDDDLLDIAAALAHKGKGKAVATATGPSPQKSRISKPRRQVRVKLPSVQTNLVTIESDDELEITDTKKKTKVDAIFNRLPTRGKQDSTSMNALRRLANLSSPPREPSNNRGQKGKLSMTVAELQMSLQQRARAQAKLERERRVEYLRSKGINVQTEEERQRERDQVEDIVARARQEVEEIMERERDEAKQARKERKKNGEDDPLGWDDSDDDDDSFRASDDEKAPEADIELSGSEEEEDNEGADADGDDKEEPAANPMFDDEAEDGDSEEEETAKPTVDDGKVVSDGEEDELPTMRRRRSKKQSQVVSDDDDDEEVKATPKRKTASAKSPSQHDSGSPKIPTSVLRSATKSFIPGLPVPAAGPAGLGLTQIFAGTMDDSQAGPSSGFPQDFMPSLNEFPDSQFSATAGPSQIDGKVPNSQATQNNTTQGHDAETQGVQLHFTQSQGHGFDSLMQMDNMQMSQLIEPTQDSGYQNFTPLKKRFVDAPHSTMDTVMLGGTASEDIVQESPLLKRKGKLRRRGEASLSISSLPPADVPGSPSTAPSVTIAKDDDVTMSTEGAENAKNSAFRLMEKAAKRKKRREEKLKVKMGEAKEWLEQEADESEDEYAGLGGADGEDSSDDDEELRKEMIDDAAGNDVDEGKLAGFYADRERAADAAQVDKLFRDITTGMLRKRRRGGGGGDGNDLDLSDSDDGGEAKRRMKRRQFAKMQKALFADERIGKIAENPRNAAFLKSIEDRGSDDEWDFGENFASADAAAEESSGESQNQNQQPQEGEAAMAIPDSQPTNNAGRKRSRMDNDAPRQPAPNSRRTAARDGAGTRPASLTDVRRELSTLLDDPNTLISSSIIPATEAGDSEGEEGDGDGDDHRRSSASSNKENTRRSGVAVVDRITLKRSSSSNVSSESARLAFAAPAGGSSNSNGAFKVPALLRKATTNSLISNSSAGSSASSSNNNNNNAGGSGGGDAGRHQKKPGTSFGEEAKLKKTAGRGSGVNYFARETERRAAVAEADKRREKRKWKGVEGQKKVVQGLFGSGRFE